MDDDRLIRRYWGKAKPETNSGPQWHPLVYHCLDVAACGRKLLEADTERRRRLWHGSPASMKSHYWRG